jgi:hypothetical protein
MRRLQRVLNRNILVRMLWKKESGYIFRVGSARISFLSGDPDANIVGATANLLLECDEAQDVQPAKWDKDVAPMAASTNATRVFWGTAWTSKTLLARELRLARQAEKQDGVRRAFVLTAEEVVAEVPAYGRFVAEQVAAFARISRSMRSCLISRRKRANSCFSSVVRPSERCPASISACLNQLRMLSAVGSNSSASSFGVRPARTSSTICWRNSGG